MGMHVPTLFFASKKAKESAAMSKSLSIENPSVKESIAKYKCHNNKTKNNE